MKKTLVFASLVMGLAVVACNNAEPVAEGEVAAETAVPTKVMTAKDFKPTKAEIDSVSYLLGINYGTFLKSHDFGDKLNYAEMVKGIKDFLKAENTNLNDPEVAKQFKIDPNTLNDTFNRYLEKRHNLASYENREKEEKFLAENAKKPGVMTTESGLQYEIIEAGNDVKPSVTDTVYVHYKGAFTDGSIFDQTPEGGDPINFTLGQVISGWSEGLQLIGEGGKIVLYIPSSLGYGTQGNQAIPPYSTLVFDVELVKVGKVAVEE